MEKEHILQLLTLCQKTDLVCLENMKKDLSSYLESKIKYLTHPDKIYIQKLWEDSGGKTKIFNEE